jgi:branched chain amino acid efflux pump
VAEASGYLWAAIAGTALMALFTRTLFMLPAGRLRLSPALERGLRCAPAAALMAIIVPDLFMVRGEWFIAFDNPRLVGGLVGFAVAAATRDVLATLIAGMLALTVVRLLAA